VLATDKTGAVTWKAVSDAFGETKVLPPSRITMNLRFAGQYFDAESSTHYNLHRDYNPQTGRYLQSDPIGLEGGINLFAYVNGNPLVRIDTLGLRAQLCCRKLDFSLVGNIGCHCFINEEKDAEKYVKDKTAHRIRGGLDCIGRSGESV